MSFEDLAVFFAVLFLCRVERNWSLAVRQVVTEPLSCSMIEERVSNEIFFVVVVGGASAITRGGRAVPWTDRIYDCTKGFQGEDVSQQT